MKPARTPAVNEFAHGCVVAPSVKALRNVGGFLAAASRSTVPGGCDSGDYAAFGVVCCHANNDPAAVSQRFSPRDVSPELTTVGPVVVAVVLDRQFDLFPAHVEH